MNVVEGSWYAAQHKAAGRAGNIKNQRKNGEKEGSWTTGALESPVSPLTLKAELAEAGERNDGVGARMLFFSARYPGPLAPF